MIITVIIILSCFIGLKILILTDKLNRAIASLAGAVISYLALVFLEGYDYPLIFQFLQGVIFISVLIFIFLLLYTLIKFSPKRISTKLLEFFSRIKNFMIK